jgi:uncharacterized protein (DUF2141 family)
MTFIKDQNTHSNDFLRYLFIVFIISMSLSVSSQTLIKKGSLKVVVHNIKSKTGQIGFYLFNSEDGFPGHTEKAILSGFVKISGNTVEYTFPIESKGTYAVYVFHDEDNNKKLNANFIGMPKEGIGVSNNAKGHFGPPKYNDAKINFNKPEQTVTIFLTYL